MLKKRCHRCRRYSFSSDEMRKWICPYCQKDISHVKAEPPITFTVRKFHQTKERKRDDFFPESVLKA